MVRPTKPHANFVVESRKIHGDAYDYPDEYKRSTSIIDCLDGTGTHKKLFLVGEVGDVMQLGEEVHVKRVFWAALTSRMR